MTTRDYSAIEAEYASGQMTLEELSQKYRVPGGTLRRVASLQDWTVKREQYRADTSAQALEIAKSIDIDVRRAVLEAFGEAQRAWLAGSDGAKRRDYPAIAKLAAAIVGEATEHVVSDERVVMADLSAEAQRAIELISDELARAKLGRGAVEAESVDLPDFGA